MSQFKHINKNITKNDILNDIGSGDISLNIGDFKISGFTSTELNNVGISLKELSLEATIQQNW